MKIQSAIAQLLERENLKADAMHAVMQQIMTGECTDAQIGGFLIALRMKGESVEEITAAARVMSSLADQVKVDDNHLIDIVGTGGDGTSTFNVSTAAAFVAAAAGACVAKHGNRSVSSQSGSADLLESSGANLNLSASQVSQVIKRVGVGFMFAPMHHSAMKHAIGPRKEMAVRTIFNLLGPLTNPAGVRRHVVGVYDPALTETIAQVLADLGSEHALVVHSEDGMDEISVCAPTRVSEMREGKVTTYTVRPEDFAMPIASIDDIVVDGPAESLALIDRVFAADSDPSLSAAKNIIALNAGAGIYIAGVASSLGAGVESALAVIQSGQAAHVKAGFVKATQSV